MTSEQREHKRLRGLFDVAWEGSTTGKYEAQISDISAGGCFVDTIEEVAVGENIKLELTLPVVGRMELQGVVLYQFPNLGFGVRFTELSDSDRLGIERLTEAAHSD